MIRPGPKEPILSGSWVQTACRAGHIEEADARFMCIQFLISGAYFASISQVEESGILDAIVGIYLD
jgi:hypothetical protein